MSSQSSSEDDQSHKERKSAFIVKKPHFLRRARTLPYELRLLKQRQHNRRKELEKRQRNEIDIQLSVIEMELSELNQLLSEDVAKAIRQELLFKYNICTGKPHKSELVSDIYSNLGSPVLDLSAEKEECGDSNTEWEENFERVTQCEEISADETAFMIRTCADCTFAPSTSAGSSRARQESEERLNTVSTYTDVIHSSPDIEVVELIEDDEEEIEVDDDEEEVEVDDGEEEVAVDDDDDDDDDDSDADDNDSDDDEIKIVQEINHQKPKNKSAYQRYRDMQELWNIRVSKIKDLLSQKRRSEQSNTSSWRIRNFKNLLQYVREIEDLLHKPNITRDEEHYAQLQARVSITKFMEVCGFEQFNHLDGKSILILRQADKELAAFHHEWWKSKMSAKE